MLVVMLRSDQNMLKKVESLCTAHDANFTDDVLYQVCLYFINLVVEDYQHWSFMQTPEMVERRKFYPHRMPPSRKH